MREEDRRCGRCMYYAGQEGAATGECRRDTPRTQLVPVPDSLDPQRMKMVPFTWWPGVSPTGHYCYRWRSAIDDLFHKPGKA